MSARESGADEDMDRIGRSWIQSRIREIRTLLLNRRHRNHSSRGSHALSSRETKRTTSESESTPPDGVVDGDDEANLYLSVNHLGNDEEIAMIRACSQMSKYVIVLINHQWNGNYQKSHYGYFHSHRYGWYWGPLSRHAAQRRLHGQPNGSFLVRNSQINRNSFTVSFRTAGNTLHHRIEFADGFW